MIWVAVICCCCLTCGCCWCSRQLLGEAPGSGSQGSSGGSADGCSARVALATGPSTAAAVPKDAQAVQTSCAVCGKTPMQARVCSRYMHTSSRLKAVRRGCCEVPAACRTSLCWCAESACMARRRHGRQGVGTWHAMDAGGSPWQRRTSARPVERRHSGITLCRSFSCERRGCIFVPRSRFRSDLINPDSR
jgi:hypothetical protein